LLDPDPWKRREALEAATHADRPKVMLAAVRGGGLWSQPGPGGVDAGRELLEWLLRKGTTLLFARWLAEDARYGHLAWGRLAFDDPSRTLQRVPEWLATGGDPEGIVDALWGKVNLLAALGFRLGGAGLDQSTIDRVLSRYRWYDRWWAPITVWAGRRQPSAGVWIPDAEVLAAATRRRRWPIERIEPGGLVLCGFCGESLPSQGSCRFCGREPDDDASLQPVLESFHKRNLCPRCGIDVADVAPVLCPGCQLDLTTPGTAPTAG